MNLIELLVRQARERPAATAIVDARRAVSFKELEEESARYGGVLSEAGLRPGDTALVVCPMGIPLYVTVLGLLRLGLVAMFVDPSGGVAHLDRCCRRVRPRAFLGTRRAQVFRFLSRAVREIPIHAVVARNGDHAASPAPVERCGAGTPAIVTFTTGSTGAPKAAVRTHGFLLAQHRAVADGLRLTAGDVDLTTLPMFVLANLASGVASVVPDADLRYPAAIDPEPVLRQIRERRPTRTVASPAFLDRMASQAASRGERLESLTRVFAGGGPVFPRVMDRLASAAPHADIAAVYGSTEAEPIAILDRTDIGVHYRDAIRQGRGLPAGRPVASLRLGILPDRWGEPLGACDEQQFEQALLSPGQAGEIVVSGDHVLPGYLDGYGDEENKCAVGGTTWHRTGDAGSLDASGRLWLLGRCSAKVEDGRGTLYPFSVEAAAHECEGVERAALIGCDGRRILAVQSGDGDERHVRATVERALGWATLDEIRMVARIPVDPRHNAKVDYERLAALLKSRRSASACSRWRSSASAHRVADAMSRVGAP